MYISRTIPRFKPLGSTARASYAEEAGTARRARCCWSSGRSPACRRKGDRYLSSATTSPSITVSSGRAASALTILKRLRLQVALACLYSSGQQRSTTLGIRPFAKRINRGEPWFGVLDVEQRDVTDAYAKRFGEQNQAIRHLIGAFDYDYLYNGFLQPSAPKFSKRSPLVQ
jgi:hypothetical protein